MWLQTVLPERQFQQALFYQLYSGWTAWTEDDSEYWFHQHWRLADANIRTFLDGRILNALPIGWQQIIKQVKVGSTIGDKSSEVVTADSYFYLPSVAELFPSQNVEPYIYEGTAISFMTDNTSRICNDENGNPAAYWTRSPNAQYGSYSGL